MNAQAEGYDEEAILNNIDHYFDSCSWYYGTLSPDEFDKNYDSNLNEYEKKNATTIKEYEKEQGYNE